MRLPTRFRVRTLMIVVALVALAFGLPVEWMNHRRRDQALQAAVRQLDRAAWHHGLAAACLRNAGRKPYPRAERMAVIDGYLGAGTYKGAGLDQMRLDWEGEAEWHLYWGHRIHDQARGAMEKARAYESRLLIP